jgi:hypothetical protein
MSAIPPKADIAGRRLDVRSVPKADVGPPKSRASLLVGHNYARIVSPHGSLQLGGINLLELCPFDKVGRAIRRISAPPLEHAGVDRLVEFDVASVFNPKSHGMMAISIHWLTW